MAQYRIQQIEDYEALIGAAKIERIRNKAKEFKGLRVANFNSTYYGGGVAEMLSSMTLLMNSLGLQTEWRVIQGTPDFFSITKKMHNALQGGEIDLSSIKKEVFEQVIYENSFRNFRVDARLVLLGNFATDDPEGEEIFDSLCACRNERILILTSGDDTALVNALQTRAAVVLQKSLREGFGLTVAEAMWKGTPVIGGNVGGILYQIEDGVNGFLVSSVDETAERMVEVINDGELRDGMGRKAHETVRENFLLTRYLEQYLDLFGAL